MIKYCQEDENVFGRYLKLAFKLQGYDNISTFSFEVNMFQSTELSA